jgi:hypothetical protein
MLTKYMLNLSVSSASFIDFLLCVLPWWPPFLKQKNFLSVCLFFVCMIEKPIIVFDYREIRRISKELLNFGIYTTEQTLLGLLLWDNPG